MNMFNFAYNLLTLKFKKANQQLDPEVLSRTLDYLNIGNKTQLAVDIVYVLASSHLSSKMLMFMGNDFIYQISI